MPPVNSQLQTAQTAPTTHPPKDEKEVEYVPWGGNQAIRLSVAMVRTLIATPTRTGKVPSDRDCFRFIMLCKGKRANPFEGDCYLTGYDSQDGPQFSMICGVELFLKRAEQSDVYQGYEGGVIVQRGQEIIEVQGSFTLDTDKLLGGWCRVTRSDRPYPFVVRVKRSTYDTQRSRWKMDPAGMIEKVAISQAHRKAYPTSLGGLYSNEEMAGIMEVSVQTLTRDPVPMPRALGEGERPASAKTLESGGAGSGGGAQSVTATPQPEGGSEQQGPRPEPENNAERIRYALADLDFDEPRFVAGLILIKYANVPKSTKAIDDLREDVIDRIWTEGLDDLIGSIQSEEDKAAKKA